jgi:hypothetical protein
VICRVFEPRPPSKKDFLPLSMECLSARSGSVLPHLSLLGSPHLVTQQGGGIKAGPFHPDVTHSDGHFLCGSSRAS